jgi:hypothetical protein
MEIDKKILKEYAILHFGGSVKNINISLVSETCIFYTFGTNNSKLIKWFILFKRYNVYSRKIKLKKLRNAD